MIPRPQVPINTHTTSEPGEAADEIARRDKIIDVLMDRIEPLVQRAYQQSEITCMFCGEPGIFRPRGWAHVSCERCEADLLRKD